ncbi:cbb3-type cytochrome c oxidase subunit I [Gorillibacterium massiliense]|uniref:cbb3-type cytochrome c oxidase subunit I n=1 Tax=Gorillibacterium massiliense TaxID=1280390 RepID=UPI0004B5A71E|nr:cbb3-type cytochrome c oxidase subunit I [Gorillibacterium massiliense]
MFRLPFLFIVTGIISFTLFQLYSLGDFASWLTTLGDTPRYSTGWFRVHLLVLGWGTMIAMGAVYQLIPVVLQNHNLFSRKLGFVHYGFFAVGTAGLLIGFQTITIPVIAAFATLAFIGILLFAFNIGMTLYRAKKWNTVTLSTALAVGYLVLTGLSGMLMGLNFYFQQWGNFHDQLLGAHIWFGAFGWFGMLITGFSYKMYPMFYLSHGHPEKLQKVVIGLWNIGVLTGAFSFLFGAPLWLKWCGFVLIAAALTVYTVHLAQMVKHRHKNEPGAGMKWAQTLSGAISLIAIIVVLLLPFFPGIAQEPRLLVIMGWIYIFGWIGLTILSYLSKIVPFLWWTHKYGPVVGKQKTPVMSQMISDRYVHIAISCIVGSLFLMLLGLGWSLPYLTSIGGSLLALCSLIYAGMIALVFTK